jgi:starvation-inducible DNA-binding protein
MLLEKLKIVLGTTFTFYVKTHGFHFNVEGPNFPQYHTFLGDLYNEVYGSIDPLGEIIRQLDSYTPGSMARYQELSVIQEQTKVPRAELMMAELYEDNQKIIVLLKETFHQCESEDEQGIADFIAGRIDSHSKHSWMLRSILKKDRG